MTSRPRSQDEALGLLGERETLNRSLQLVDQEITEAQEALIKRMIGRVNDMENPLGAEEAVQAWIELASYHKVGKALVKREKQTRSAGTMVEGQM